MSRQIRFETLSLSWSKLVLSAVLMAALVQPCRAYTILVWGDSLSSAYGLRPDQGWVSLLNARLSRHDLHVVNESIPGETSFGGLERIGKALAAHAPDLVILGLGSNDGLRGLDTGRMRDNLALMIQKSLDSGAQVLLLGMRIPPNYGKHYSESFHEVFTSLAEQFPIPFVPFFLEPVAVDFDLMLEDGFHPNATAQPILLEHIWPAMSLVLP